MSDEKTEKATPKKREDAKKEGRIARGADLPTAVVFLASIYGIKLFAAEIFQKTGYYIQGTAFQIRDSKALELGDVHDLFIDAGKMLAVIIAPILVIGFASSVVGNFAQGGFTLNAGALKPRGSKFNPAENIKKIFSADSAVNLIKTALKLVLLVAVSYGVLTPIFEIAPSLVHAPVPVIAVKLGEILYSLAFRCGLLFLTLGLADYGYSFYKHEKSLRMTKQEIRDEYKNSEGNPEVKGQRRRAARAIAQKRSMAEVPTASVVITNPTHYAVALRYDKDKDAAPTVVAKGADAIAAKIRAIANENDIPLIENPPLARALYRSVEPNQIIPVEFFGAVAEILVYVFKQKGNQTIH